MNSFVQSIKFRIIFAFGICVALMAAIGLFGAFGLSRLNSNMSNAYSGNRMPIAQLSDVRAAQLNIRANLRRLLPLRSPDDVARTVPQIQESLETISQTWASCYPAGITDDEERRIADRINGALQQFKSQTSDAIAALAAGNFDVASDLINRSATLSDTVTTDLGADAANNQAQAKRFANDSDSTFRIYG